MSNTQKKMFCCVISVLLLLISFCVISIWYHGKLVFFEIGSDNKSILTTEELELSGKDFEKLEDGTFIATSPDPWFTVEVPYPVKTIVIDLEEISDKRNAQIFFYSEKQDLSTENSYYFVLNKGINYFQIPKGEYTKFRLDLVENTGVKIKINNITLYGSRVFSSFFVMTVIILWGISARILYMCMFQKEQLVKRYGQIYHKLGSYRFYKLFLCCGILVTIFFVYGRILISGHEYVYYDIGGGDEPETYFPQFVSYINKIRTGTLSTWNFNNGLGTSTTSFWGYALNPYLLIVFMTGAIFGISTINTMVLVVQILNIIICGLLCYKYLDNFRGTHLSKAVASYIFSFNGYMVLYAQHYVHSQFCFYLLIMLLIIEELISSEKVGKYHFYFSLWCALLFSGSVYIGYMIGLFSGVYVIFRIIQLNYKLDSKTIILKKIGSLLFFASMGIMLAMPFLLPVIYELLFSSDRISRSDMGMWDKIVNFTSVPYPKEALKTIILRLFSNNLEGAGNDFIGATGTSANDYYSAPTLFFSVFFPTFTSVYYITLYKREQIKFQYILRVVAGLLVGFMIFNRFGSAIFNALVTTFGRYSYLLMPIFAIVTVVALDEIRNLSSKRKYIWIIPMGITLFIMLYQYEIISIGDAPSYLTKFFKIEAIILLISIVAFLLYGKVRISSIYLMFILLIFGNVVLDSFVTVNCRVFCLFSEDLTDEDDYDTEDALVHINTMDSTMYRIEKNYYDLIYFNDAFFQNYRGISTYNSTLSANVKEFYRLYCNPAVNFYGADGFWYSYMNISNDVLQSSLMGIRYILSDGRSYQNGIYKLIYENEKVAVYENKASKSFGVFYDNAIMKSDVVKLNYCDRLDVLSRAVVIEDEDADNAINLINYAEVEEELGKRNIIDVRSGVNIFPNDQSTYKMIDHDIIVSAMDNACIDIMFEKDMQIPDRLLYLEFSTDLSYEDNLMIFFDTGDGFETLTPYYYRGNSENNWQEAKILLPKEIKQIRMVCSKANMVIRDFRIVVSDGTIIPDKTTVTVDLVKDSLLRGKVINENEGYLFLPVPYDKGWTASVDGEAVPIIRVDSAFMALQLPKGEHIFKIEYNYPFIGIGVAIAIVGMTILVICYRFLLKSNKKV